MGIAKLSGMRSKDPNTQVGACIVSEDNKILSVGYNGFPIGCSDEDFPWDRNHSCREPAPKGYEEKAGQGLLRLSNDPLNG